MRRKVEEKVLEAMRCRLPLLVAISVALIVLMPTTVRSHEPGGVEVRRQSQKYILTNRETLTSVGQSLTLGKFTHGGSTANSGSQCTNGQQCHLQRPLIALNSTQLIRAHTTASEAQHATDGLPNLEKRDVGHEPPLSSGEDHYLFNLTPYTKTYLKFLSSETDEIKVVTQLLSHHYDGEVPVDNCMGYHVSVEILPDSQVNWTEVNTHPSHPTNGDTSGDGAGKGSESGSGSGSGGSREGHGITWSAFWNAVAMVMDTSSFCDLLPTVAIRVEPEKKQSVYVALFDSSVGLGGGLMHRSDSCLIGVYITHTNKKMEENMQNTFAFALPLLLLVALAPITFMDAHLVSDYMADIDVILWMVYPAIGLRNAIVWLAMYAYQKVWGAYVERRERKRQRDLEERHRQLMRETTTTPMVTNAHGGSSKVDDDDDVGLRSQAHVNGCLESQSPAEAAQAEVQNGSEREIGLSGTTAIHMEPSPPSASRATDIVVENMVDMDLDDDEDYGTRRAMRRPLIASHKQAVKHGRSATAGNDSPALQVTDRNDSGNVQAGASGKQVTSGCDDDDERVCRICRDDEAEEKLISACECTGSVRWIHLSCLDKWRMESKVRNSRNVNRCEICMKPFRVPISKRILIMKNLQRVALVGLMILCVVVMFIVVTVSQRATLGELTCRTQWHTVAYSTMFDADGIILTVFVQLMLTLLAAFAFAVVYGWWHTRPETMEHLAIHHTLPPFWTRRNILSVLAFFGCGVMQALSLGLLLKLFMYRTSTIVWTWEASPCTGAVLFMGYVSLGMWVTSQIQVAVRRRRQQREREREQATVEQVVSSDEDEQQQRQQQS
ncbi:unnamed protein product [Trypanosoma congolense IL3000]|uniref:WGS project CAEQ00000000 data, annotated contig 640 n=1 Tax=Trypanosoma congolense (strain IL3000) TaxID=1068625 RepID=F9WHF5_TRYCI|nr:unnamed protein product [Trypanosoma congolense IL3000]